MQSIDNDKRGKMILVAILVTVLVIVLKLVQQTTVVDIPRVFMNAAIVAGVSFLGLLWAFRFQVTFRTLAFVLLQSALIVFNLASFLDMFVFRRVGRVYEILVLLTVSIFLFATTYASYLMANIFNVAHFKEIPLVQVGKTTSYLLSLLSVYISTYVILQSQFPIYVTIPILFVMYFLIILLHIRHLGVPRNLLWNRFLTIMTAVLISLIVLLIVGGNPLISSLIPVVVAYSIINISMLENISIAQQIEYFTMTFIVLVGNFFFR